MKILLFSADIFILYTIVRWLVVVFAPERFPKCSFVMAFVFTALLKFVGFFSELWDTVGFLFHFACEIYGVETISFY